MSRRRAPTFTDYLVIAIAPAYIMLLVGSLVFFLLTAFYNGAYDFRLRYIAGLFVFAAVLIGRISIREGTEYAAAFAVPLALATWVTLGRFTDASSLVMLLIIGVTWWSAHKLTWDCTVLDEQEEAVGEGLLQSAGFDVDKRPLQTAELPLDSSATNDPIPEAKTPNGGSSAGGDAEPAERPGIVIWWNRWIENRRRPHAPGVWVIYYVLITLPLFGIGQWWIPRSDDVSRQSAFHCLVVYVASALALMGTTSFLGIRRYLRQRRLEMPAEMAVTWAAATAALIVGILLVCSLLPRPSADSAFDSRAGSREHDRADRFAWLRDGAAGDDREGVARNGDSDPPSPADDSDPSNATGAASTDSDSDSGDDTNDAAKDNTSEKGSPSGRSQGQSNRQPSHQDGDRKAAAANSRNGAPERGGQHKAQPPPDERQNDRSSQPKSSPAEASTSENENSPPANSPPRSPQSLFQSLAAAVRPLLKLMYWVLVLGVVIYFCWRHGQAILQAIAQFIDDMKMLFRGKPTVETNATEEEAPIDERRAFSTFQDPFQTRKQLPDNDLIRHTFLALEAWAREHASPRQANATPYEFARKLAARFPAMGATTGYLVQQYDQLAYASGNGLDPVSRDRIQKLWQQMQQT